MQPHFTPETTGIRWLVPVDVTVPECGHRVFHGPSEALCYLIHECHSASGLTYEAAKSACIDALRHTRDAEEARRAFLDALGGDHPTTLRH